MISCSFRKKCVESIQYVQYDLTVIQRDDKLRSGFRSEKCVASKIITDDKNSTEFHHMKLMDNDYQWQKDSIQV